MDVDPSVVRLAQVDFGTLKSSAFGVGDDFHPTALGLFLFFRSSGHHGQLIGDQQYELADRDNANAGDKQFH